jgi:hypothetical protein
VNTTRLKLQVSYGYHKSFSEDDLVGSNTGIFIFDFVMVDFGRSINMLSALNTGTN